MIFNRSLSMIRKPLRNHYSTAENSLDGSGNSKTNLPFSKLRICCIKFVESIKRSVWPGRENFRVKLDILIFFLEMKVIPSEKFHDSIRTSSTTTVFHVQVAFDVPTQLYIFLFGLWSF